MYEVENPEIRALLELRTQLGEELDRLRERIEQLEEFIQALDATIGKGSFTTADVAIEDTERAPVLTPTETLATSGEPRSIVIMNKSGDLEMATVEVIEQNLRIIPADHAIYNITRGAFARFFIQEILGKFQQEDRHRVESGEISWDNTFDFEVKSDDKILDEVVVKNFGDEARLEEIQRTLRWTLEKIYRAR
ncbi:MAG: hypothetical protein E3J86_09360 [Candidatus Thorarchaeota archaeon]|nr:MAG: hypothetical protein E3J86_09360 [Candidatus Thorarchaeota archaeon]